MGSTIIAAINVVLVIALCVSIAQFLSESRLGAESVRRLAAISAIVALLVTVLIYSGEFRRNVLTALRYLDASSDLYDAAGDVLVQFDHICTQIANEFNDLIGAGRVGYRPRPTPWPALLLATAYCIRFLIYRFHKRNGNLEAALTGAVYWNHITAYVMAIAFLIVVSGVNAWVLIPLSILALVAVIVSVKLLVEDLGVAVRAALQTVWTEITRLARRIVFHATAFAAWIRTQLAYANALYLARIRNPLRARVAALEARNDTARRTSRERLKAQDTDHQERFANSARTRRARR